MSRITYLELPAIFIGAILFGCMLMILWVMLLIPAMFSRKIRGMGNLQDQITATLTKVMMKGMMKSSIKGMVRQ
jgi:hypothetical protein